MIVPRLGMFALALSAGSLAMASEDDSRAPLVVAGGELDPAFPDADVYLAEPDDPDIPPGRACEIAQRYVQLVNARDYSGIAKLYADDAIFLEPMRPTLQGREQIDEFYTKRIGAMTPQVKAVSYLGGERECMIALALKTDIEGEARWVLVSVDHFIVREDGKIASMTAFARPPREGL